MPKYTTRQSYLERLNRVDDYIHAHLDADLSIERLAEVACLSPYHWSRIYAAMRGETVAVRIRRLRLQRAADRLANTDIALDRISELAGYSSTDTFGRAFRDAFGEPPAQYRALGKHAAFKQAISTCDARCFPVSVVTLPDQRCAGVDHIGSYMRIDHAMGRLFTALSKQGTLPEVPSMIGVFFDDPDLGEEAALRSRACMPVGNDVAINTPLAATMLKGGLYAKLNYTGPYAAMRDAYRWLLGTWLPASGYEPGDAPVFEVYLNDPGQVPQSELRTDIHLPLKAPQ
ncbi:GyrI-like domain-containing protein [Roseinatronobacter sp. S2]|uniref:AraC family transcriptional regulator n=1 Tax=Roseinatronobacter sp. S2 TaxID=3035471 RepID=UPI0024104488|nr:AraC family transcriptional regulator [Roseinatronobacter sp. S2]WFE74229.1 AraC family transcriptional regulator [Roseinatronobacter sp. S2]